MIDRMARVRVLENVPATRNDEIARYRFNDSKGVMFGILIDRFGIRWMVNVHHA